MDDGWAGRSAQGSTPETNRARRMRRSYAASPAASLRRIRSSLMRVDPSITPFNLPFNRQPCTRSTNTALDTKQP
jgi:hypothetical protein